MGVGPPLRSSLLCSQFLSTHAVMQSTQYSVLGAIPSHLIQHRRNLVFQDVAVSFEHCPFTLGPQELRQSMTASLVRGSTSPFDQTFLSAAYVKKTTPCRACKHAILPLHVKLGLVRRIHTSRFPCQKAHWYHPLCLPAGELDVLKRYGSVKGVPIGADLMSCVDTGSLSDIHRDMVKRILTVDDQSTAPGKLQLTPEFTNVGTQHRRSKRKRSNDEEYIPASAARAPPSAKRRYSGACRAAVQETIAAFKTKFFEEHADTAGHVPCAVSGLPVSINEAHVDHAPPNTFDTIVKGFLHVYAAEHNTTPAHVLAHSEYVAGRFFDHNKSAAFLEYHTANASLRILTARTNLSLPRMRQRSGRR
jgi:hypothetical protein